MAVHIIAGSRREKDGDSGEIGELIGDHGPNRVDGWIVTGRLRWRNSGQDDLGKTGQKGDPRKGKTWKDWKRLDRPDRLDRLEKTGQRKKEEAPPQCDGNQSCIRHDWPRFLPVATLRMRGPRLVRNSTDTGYITVDYPYYDSPV